MKNPYVWNAIDPDMCYGRDTLLHDLTSGLVGCPRYSFGLAGGRRMGKTTVLRRVQRDLLARTDEWNAGQLLVIPIYVDGLALPRPLTENDIWELLLRQLPPSLLGTSHTLEKPDFEVFKRTLLTAFRDIEEQPRVVIMFDEIEHILACDPDRAFFSHCRALLSNTPDLSDCITAVFAGARELDELRRDVGSPLKDILEWRNLHALTYEDACRLMQEPIGRRWDCEFLARTYRETGGHPMLLQYVMQHVCKLWSDAYDSDSMVQLIEQATEKFARERQWQFTQWWARYCSRNARRVYARIFDSRGNLELQVIVNEFGLDEANDAVELLQHVGLVEKRDDGLSFCCIGDMFRKWYARYGVLDDAPRRDSLHDSELYARLVEIRKELGDKYLSAWRIYQAEMPNYSGAVGELRDTLTLLLEIVAPMKRVQSEAGFRLEQGQERPTRRQRVRYAARVHSGEHVKEIASDYDLVEQLSTVVTRSYGRASGQTHTTATREQAYRALKQWESIFAQLIPSSENMAIGARE